MRGVFLPIVILALNRHLDLHKKEIVMRITPVGNILQMHTQTREHHNASHFQELLEAYMKRA